VYRLLQPEEWDRIREPLQKSFPGKEPPPPVLGTQCAIEEDEAGNINGFLFLQVALHIEPFGSLGGSSFGELRKVLDQTLTDIPNLVYYLHTDTSAGIAAFTKHGFKVKGILLEGSPHD
jgi:hypothetical protein